MAAISSARTELNCKPRLYDILGSQNGCSTPSPEMIDYSRKMDHRTSFDEECRKIQCEGDMAGETVNGSERSLRDLIQEDMHILKQREKGTVVKRQRGSKQPSTSAEMPATHKHRDSEGFRTSVVLEKHDRVDVILQQGRMGTRSFAGETRFESKPFSEALEVLNSDKDLIMDILSEPSCLQQKCSRHLQSSQTERGTFSSVFDHQSTKTCPTSQQSKKPAELQNGKSSGKVGCHCSSGQPRDGSSSRALNGSLTYFSVREIKRKLNHTFGRSRRRRRRKEPNSDSTTSGKLSHSRSIFGHDCIYRGVEAKSPLSHTSNAKAKEKLGRKQGLKVESEQPQAAWEADTVRRKIDVSSHRWCVDVDSVATGDLPARLEDIDATGSREIDSCLSPRRVSQYCPGSARVSFSPYRQRFCPSPMRSSKELTVTPYDSMTETVSTETSSSLVPSSDEEERDEVISPTRNMKFNEMPNVAETNSIVHSEAGYDTVIGAANIKLQDEYGSLLHSVMEYFPSSPTRITQLDMHDTKNQEEHLSPVSVLDQSFAEEYSSSPSNTASQSGRDPLKPRRLHFEECTSASPSQVAPVTASQCVHKQDYTICNFVRAIIKASSLDWDQLSEIRPLSEHLLHPSIFDQAQFLLPNSHFDTRLLVDHVNEVLLQTQRSHFVSPYWPALAKPRICCLPLEEAVIDEIMREAQFYLLPQTQKRTLDQLVAKDLSGSRLQLDLRPETEHIIVHISEDILEESVLDVILQLHS